MANEFFGFELMRSFYNQSVGEKADVIVLYVHWFLVKNGFECLGFGDSKTLSAEEEGSELLPEEWSKGPNYTYRYRKDGKLFILVVIKSEGNALINFLRVEDHAVSSIQIPLESIADYHGKKKLADLIPNYVDLTNEMKKEFAKMMDTSQGNEVSTQTSTTTNQSSEIAQPPFVQRLPPSSLQETRGQDPLRIGRDDLNPFGSGGGGMIFDPFGPGNNRALNPYAPTAGIPQRLPFGSVPPGARFDPFGPPDIGNPSRRNPDNDHLPPPGFDDMFM